MSRSFLILICGEGGVGKTSVAFQFVEGTFLDEYDPTIDTFFKEKEVTIDYEVINLQLFDMGGGQSEYIPILSRLKNEIPVPKQAKPIKVDGALLVYSITSDYSYKDLSREKTRLLNELQYQGGHLQPPKSDFPFVLIGNKVDLDGAGSRQVEKVLGEELAREWDIEFFETSAKDGTNLNLAFEALVRAILRKERVTNEITQENKKQDKCCVS